MTSFLRCLRIAGPFLGMFLVLLGPWYFQPGRSIAEDAATGKAITKQVVENVVLISIDGLRGEEVFSGADRRLMIPELGVKDLPSAERAYWDHSPQVRRERLMPFLWRMVRQGGWIAGDIGRDSNVSVTNGRFFSYPGYSEILCGLVDDKIDSNAKKYNENVTVLEWLNHQPGLEERVQAFCSWDVFPYIINDRRSGVKVNAGWMPLTTGNPDRLFALNMVAENLFHEWDSVRYDSFTVAGALEAMRSEQPRVLYVGMGETDDWAHAGRYDRYLLTARQNDNFIKMIWNTINELPNYREKTAVLIVTDHGRGDGREGWKSHGVDLPGSERIWLAAFGAGITASGVDSSGRFTQSQVAATVADFLGFDFTTHDPRIAQPLPIASR